MADDSLLTAVKETDIKTKVGVMRADDSSMTISFKRLHKRDNSEPDRARRFQESRVLSVRFCGTRWTPTLNVHEFNVRVTHTVRSHLDIPVWFRWWTVSRRQDWRLWHSEISDATLNLPRLSRLSKTIIQSWETCLRLGGCTLNSTGVQTRKIWKQRDLWV